MADPTEPLIRFAGVRKAFGPKVIYRRLDLDVFAGQTLVVMGGSGVGKSVLLKMLIRLLEADGGSIRYRGDEVTMMSERKLRELRRNIAMLFQGGALFDSLSVGDNVAYGLHEHYGKKLDRASNEERVAWALSLVDLPGIEDMRPAELSGGMKKRVALARAIALHPEVVLYDEPTTGLDPINATRVNHLINGLKRTLHVTSIVVTHDMSSAFAVGDRMAFVYQGEIIAVGDPESFRSPTDPRVADFIKGHAPEHEDVDTLLKA
ncbi:MAG: ATP-binding cassette domain-containing protein [Myxococcales bacterium]|nr:ATP-binding cassette domain-containing protein [Myxococcales bacterium]